MRKIFVIGGMGAGKSTVAKALAAEGLPVIDLDAVGHEVLTWDVVKKDLAETFGDDVLDENGAVIRSMVAQRAFVSDIQTRKLNRITMPRIESAYLERLAELEAKGCEAVVVEYSAFKSREGSLAHSADCIIAVVAPEEMRVERAVASGFAEDDVRRRLAQQISDVDRMKVADIVFTNNGMPEDLQRCVSEWWLSR